MERISADQTDNVGSNRSRYRVRSSLEFQEMPDAVPGPFVCPRCVSENVQLRGLRIPEIFVKIS